jgi:flagellar assembly factor FliW
MHLKTVQFGEIEIVEENIVTFSDGIIGFEEYKKFILISDKEFEPMIWLLSIEDTELEFPLLDPYVVFNDYEPGIIVNKEEILLSIVTLKNDLRKITANLKAPLLINLKKREGRQIILETDKYSINQSVFNITRI